MALKKLERETNFHVATGSPDIRSWPVVDASRASIGKVSDLLFDSDTNLVRYAVVDTGIKRVLLPIGRLSLDRDTHEITAKDYTRAQVMDLAAYNEATFDETAEMRHYQESLPAKAEPQLAAPAKIDYQAPAFTAEPEHHIKLIEEKLDVGKREVKLGEVKITKRPVAETFEQDVQLEHEEVDIVHHPVNRPATCDERVEVTGDTIRVPIFGEELTLQKRPIVKEEIEIRKHKEATTQHVSETLRHEELVVDKEVTFASSEPIVEDACDLESRRKKNE